MPSQSHSPRALLALAIAALSMTAGALAAPLAHASPAAPTDVTAMSRGHGSQDAFPPKANSVWAYDTSSPGMWADTIKDYNQQATPGHRLNEVFSYATDLEMYCPENDGTRCTADDLYSFYTPGSEGPARTAAYYDALDATDHQDPMVISPIIDGRTDANGYMQGFNELTPSLAASFADKVARQVCADPHVDGIQFDLEPFDVTSKNGQYYFYMQIAKDFAGHRQGRTSRDPYGCVDSAHPRGRFFSVFTFADSIKPKTESAGNVQDLLNAYGNGYFLDSLYDLSSEPAGTLNGIEPYRRAVRREVSKVVKWSHRLNIKYGFGIPASASAHEFTTCRATSGASGACVADSTGAVGYPMIAYTRAAVRAIDHGGVRRDPRYLGTAIWDFGDHVSWNGIDFGPVPPPEDVLDYLGTNLPGAKVRPRPR